MLISELILYPCMQSLLRHVHTLRADSPEVCLRAPPSTQSLMAGAGSSLLAQRTLALSKSASTAPHFGLGGTAAAAAGGGNAALAALAPPLLERLQMICDFFLPPGGIQAFWELARAVQVSEAASQGKRASTPVDSGLTYLYHSSGG